MGVDREEVLRVAELARLELSDDEVSALARELDQILGHVEALELRTSSFELRTSNFELRTGEGAGRDSLSGGLEGIAPDFRDGFFRVPRLGSHEGKGPDTATGTGGSGAGGQTQTHTHTEP